MEKFGNSNEFYDEKEKIVFLNDSLRKTFNKSFGQVYITQGVNQLQRDEITQIAMAVQHFDDFTPENDPYGEHDQGIVIVKGSSYYWKIDYYDNDLQYHSSDKSDPDLTKRILTIMTPNEY